MEVSSSLIQATICITKQGTLNSHQECERNPSKVQYGIVNPEEADSLDAQEALEDSEDVRGLFVEEGLEKEQPSLQKFSKETPKHLHDIIEACGISFI